MICKKRTWCDKCGRKQVRKIDTWNKSLLDYDVCGEVCFACGYWKERDSIIPKKYLSWLNKSIKEKK